MTAKYVFKVGPINRNRDYAHLVTVFGEDYNDARDKAVAFRGFKPRDTGTWLISIEEVDPDTAILERLAKLLKEAEVNG